MSNELLPCPFCGEPCGHHAARCYFKFSNIPRIGDPGWAEWHANKLAALNRRNPAPTKGETGAGIAILRDAVERALPVLIAAGYFNDARTCQRALAATAALARPDEWEDT